MIQGCINFVRPSRLPMVAPQDEDGLWMASRIPLILRRSAQRSLEGRNTVIQPCPTSNI